jgi:flagellar biosynthetic protein FlhB
MADSEQNDRTEPATQRRVEEARGKGQIPRSRDLTAAAVMLTSGIALQTLGGAVGERLASLMRSGLQLSRQQTMDNVQMLSAFGDAALSALLAIAPVLALTLVAAVGAPLALGGWAFSGSVMAPQFERLNPLAGIGRMFSARSWVELAKALAKFGVVATAGILVLKLNFHVLLGLGNEPVGAAIGHSISISGQALIALTAALIFIAAIDVPFQLWQYHRDLRMTREEVRQEARESDGSPEMKSHIRKLQRERSQRRMMADVPKADVIVVNPTHYAVALRYDDKRMRAPVVVAKGADHMAARIREVAAQHNVPIFEAPPLARALHRTVEIGDEIPANLYVAVAQVLTYVFQLRSARRDHQQPPALPVIEFTE